MREMIVGVAAVADMEIVEIDYFHKEQIVEKIEVVVDMEVVNIEFVVDMEVGYYIHTYFHREIVAVDIEEQVVEKRVVALEDWLVPEEI